MDDCEKPILVKSETSDETKKDVSTAAELEPVRFLQTMALWLQGSSDPNQTCGDDQLSGWCAQYAEKFDQETEEVAQVDLAPVLGLPQGTDKEEFARALEAQEEELLKQLIS